MKKAKEAIPNDLLAIARQRKHWTQRQVAEYVGTTTTNVCRWERGTTIPSLYFCARLCALFGKSDEELGLRSYPENPRTRNSGLGTWCPDITWLGVPHIRE
jgi:transcriptional regulator with XRE-family HTH domain